MTRARRAARRAGLGPGRRAIDVGGGPGHHAAVFAAAGAVSVLADPSADMLGRAGEAPGVWRVRARAERLPFGPNRFDLVWFHLSLHHTRWRRALEEASRILLPGGEIHIWTMGPEHFRRSYLARWFPSVPAIDGARFPDPGAVWAALRAAGYTVTAGVEIESVERNAGSWRDAVAAGFISTLQLLDPAELAAGLAAFDRAHPDPDDAIRYRLRYEWGVARWRGAH